MTNDILNFLTGGVFTTFKELIENILQWVMRFILNLSNIFLFPFVSKINALLPSMDGINEKIQYVFDYVEPYINFILDLTFISSPILIYLAASLVFRITIKNSSYLTKVILQWYEKLVP